MGDELPDPKEEMKRLREEMKDPEFRRALGALMSIARRCSTPQHLQAAMLEQLGITLGNTQARAVMTVVAEVFWKTGPARGGNHSTEEARPHTP